MRRASSKTGFKCRYCSYELIGSNWTRIHNLSYLRYVEEIGLETSGYNLDVMLEVILLRGKNSAFLVRLR